MSKSRSHNLSRYVWLPVALFLLLRLGDAMLGGASSASVRLVAVPPGSHWVATWGASAQPATTGNLSVLGFHDATIREIVLTSAGGDRLRVRLSNAFGALPLRVGGRRSRSSRAEPEPCPARPSACHSTDGARF